MGTAQNTLSRIDPYYSDARTVDLNGRLPENKHNNLNVPKNHAVALGGLSKQYFMAVSTVALRRNVIDKVGVFNPA